MGIGDGTSIVAVRAIRVGSLPSTGGGPERRVMARYLDTGGERAT